MTDTSGTDRTCYDCHIVIYDVSYSDERSAGYLNPKYCPQCGTRLGDSDE